MARYEISDRAFIKAFEEGGSPLVQKLYGMSTRAVFKRRRAIESALSIKMKSPLGGAGKMLQQVELPRSWRLDWKIPDGTIVIGSDFHLWPDARTTGQRAFIRFVKDLQPEALIVNGDLCDFPAISRHGAGWESMPTPQQEIEVTQDYLSDLLKAAGRCKKAWTRGNHDYRLEAYVAQNAPMLKGMKGIHLHDHFDGIWERCMSVAINFDVRGGEIMVKHRWKGGKHAPGNNTMGAGTHMVTGHLHSQKCYPHTNYLGTRYGVDTGMVSNPAHRAFLYTEDSPLDWREGFAVLTIKHGFLMQPEFVTVWDLDHVQFRGQVIKV